MSDHDRPPTRLASRVLSFSIVAMAILASAGCQKPVAPAPPPPPTVGVVESRRMNIPVLVTPNGTTRALEVVTIRARVRGFLTERHFDEGAFVKKGQLLLVIDEEPYKIALLLARARQAEAAAALKKSEVSKGREVALAQLELDRAQLLLANIQERRSRSLLARNAGSNEELDKAEADRKKWEAQVEADRANHEQASADFEVGIASARAQVEAANATVRDAELNLGYCRMVAPLDGRIGEAKVKVGNLVGPESMGGGTYSDLATIHQLDPIGIDVRLSSRDLDRTRELIDQGLSVRLARSGSSGELEFPEVGTCYFIDNTIDETTSTFLAKARMPNPGGKLLPGEYVKLRMVVDRLENAVVVPAPSVLETEVGTIVHVVDGKGKVVVQKVDAAQTYEGMRVITKGLDVGVSVIVEGLQSIRPGIAVKTAPAALTRKISEGSKVTSALSSGEHTSQADTQLAGPPKS
ncbi:membrane fusion protein, multidrug efflux system [Singulisphaera sp. GP187]|uniref:efflux RND transporter periplasmic adaptor subunit n=1 Tax=Singulisphaera sp. GP187 TaxID=1882752 RepID=UPI0009289975|nr:efflux RND transporter periplasmic adaptor subunit [Singulisphaera sp. GP187]SIN95832.1 membrane fusion protein, multidrug efflux system [Singulisphaera sp. GP187]